MVENKESNDKPQRATSAEMEEERVLPPPLNTGRKSRGGGLGGLNSGGVMPFIVTAIIVLLISYVVLIPYVAVTKTDFTTNIGNVVKDITALKDADKVMSPKIDAANSNVVAFAANVNTQKAGIDALTVQLNDIKNQIATANNNINNMQSNINNNLVVKSGLDALIKSSVNTADLQKAIDANKATVVDLTAKLAQAQKDIKTLQDRPSTTSSGTGGVGTAGVITTGQVTATVIGNSFTGNSMLAVPSLITNGTSSQSFVFQIANGLDVSINNIQLAIGLQLLDPTSSAQWTGAPSLTLMPISVSSFGMGTIWTAQDTGYAYYRGFVNSATGIFGGIGTLSQPKGITNYTVTITVTNTIANTTLQSFQILPVVRILNYS